jgi:serine O-acetyltransferase
MCAWLKRRGVRSGGHSREASSTPMLVAVPMPPLPGSTNQNPPRIGLVALVLEDFATHDGKLGEPGFWAVAVHRLGNARMDVRPRLLRAPFTILYEGLRTVVDWGFGIDLCYTVRLGRRVRIWHHGGMVLGAREIGDDVHIRQNTTFGVLHRDAVDEKPTIGDRVDIGAGACVLGDITVGHDSVIGANSVVVRDVPPFTTVFGVPARPAAVRPPTAPPTPPSLRSVKRRE